MRTFTEHAGALAGGPHPFTFPQPIASSWSHLLRSWVWSALLPCSSCCDSGLVPLLGFLRRRNGPDASTRARAGTRPESWRTAPGLQEADCAGDIWTDTPDIREYRR